MGKKVIIIGAGISGLATAVYLAKNGFLVEVHELNSRPGGLCTTWKRGDYDFESCLYWVFGSSRKNSFNKILRELGIMDKLEFIHFENFMVLEDSKDGSKFNLWSDLDKLALELKRYGTKKDNIKVDKLLKAAKKINSFNMYIDKPRELYSLQDYINLVKSYMPYINLFAKYKSISIEKYSEDFESEKLRQILLDFMQHIENFPLILLLLIFSYMGSSNADYPKGGSYALAKTIEDEAIKIGVDIKYNNKVEKILTENNKAVGVKLIDNKIIKSDYVVSCGDGRNTIFNLLEGKYTTNKILKQYKELPAFLSYMQVSFGVNKDFSKEMQFLLYKLKKGLNVGLKEIDQLRIRHYCFNENFAPKGKSSLVVTFKADFDYWHNLYIENREVYNLEKEKLANNILEILEEKYGELKSVVEIVDIATPSTFYRKTLNSKGSAEGWYTNCKTFDQKFSYNIKGLDNFYMAGHWTNINGGVTFAALTGRDVAMLICNKEKIDFKV